MLAPFVAHPRGRGCTMLACQRPPRLRSTRPRHPMFVRSLHIGCVPKGYPLPPPKRAPTPQPAHSPPRPTHPHPMAYGVLSHSHSTCPTRSILSDSSTILSTLSRTFSFHYFFPNSMNLSDIHTKYTLSYTERESMLRATSKNFFISFHIEQ
jgi:hypothetical protein